MKTLSLLRATAALALITSVPAFAQMKNDKMEHSDSMMSSDGHKMSASEMKTMKYCGGLSKKAMARSKRCTAMMKAHPDMMKSEMMHSDMMKKGG